MDSPLQMFRDLLPFSQPVAADQKASEAARSLLEALAGTPSLETAAALASKVIPAISVQPNLHMRFKLLDEARSHAERSLPELENHVMSAVLPLSMAATSAALHADNLLKALAAAYAGISRAMRDEHGGSGVNPLFYRGIQRAITLVSRRQLLAYRAYATPSTRSWKMLHELYQMACSPSARPIDGETAPIEHEYLGALILAYLEPGKLPHTELETIHASTRKLAAYAVLSDSTAQIMSTDSDACFLVLPNDGTPGIPLVKVNSATPVTGGLVIDCSQVLAAIDRNLARVPGKTVQPDLGASPTLLQSLRVALGGKSARRFSRTKFRPRADLTIGLDAVIHFLDGNVFTRRSLDGASGQANRGMVTSEWSLVDESPDGFRIRFIRGETTKVTAGELVALQPRESSKTHICLVRRISSAATRLELGLQLLSPQVSVVNLHCDGSFLTRAIFLHHLPAYGKFAGLITEPGKLGTGKSVNFENLGRTLHRRVGAAIEQNEGLDIFALDPLSGPS